METPEESSNFACNTVNAVSSESNFDVISNAFSKAFSEYPEPSNGTRIFFNTMDINFL